jgi:hypothetical protein
MGPVPICSADFPFAQQMFPFAQQIPPFAQQIWSANGHLLSKWTHLLSRFPIWSATCLPFGQQILHLLSRFFHLVSRFFQLVSRFSHLVTKFGPSHLVYTIWSTFGQQLGTPDIVNSTQAQVIQFPLSLEFQTEWEVSGEHFQHVLLATCTPSFHETFSFRASLNPHQKWPA